MMRLLMVFQSIVAAMAVTSLIPVRRPCWKGGLMHPADVLGPVPWDGQHAIEANRNITRGYLAYSNYARQIYFPNTDGAGSPPCVTWLDFAPYASSEVGRGLQLETHLDDILRALQDGNARLLWRSGSKGLKLLSEHFDSEALWHGSLPRADLFLHHATVLFRLLRSAPGCPLERLRAVLRTSINMLEHGNRLIFLHIGGAFWQFARWRESVLQHHPAPRIPFLTPQEVLGETGFRMDGAGFGSAVAPPSERTNLTDAQEIFHEILGMLPRSSEDLAGIFERRPCTSLLPVAFLCWELGGARIWADGADEKASLWFQMGNNLIMFCEQAEAAAPAFRPGSGDPHTRWSRKEDPDTPPVVLHGEVSRHEVMKLLTAFVRLPTGKTNWSLHKYYKEQNSSLDLHEDSNWGLFKFRYPLILDAFKQAYANLPEPFGRVQEVSASGRKCVNTSSRLQELQAPSLSSRLSSESEG